MATEIFELINIKTNVVVTAKWAFWQPDQNNFYSTRENNFGFLELNIKDQPQFSSSLQNETVY